MAKAQINKIIYFDKETIRNILQQWEKGQVEHKTGFASTLQNQGSLGMELSSKIKLDVPFLARLSFLVSGKLETSFITKMDNVTTISSTEISEFEKIKPALKCLTDVILFDIENSSTCIRAAGGYLRILKGGIDGVDTREFKTVMENYDGYDTYKIDESNYVRFNNSAFVSNYKRNDLLTTRMTLYCIPVGLFTKDRFDFLKEIAKMQEVLSSADGNRSLADIYPPSTNTTDPTKEEQRKGKNGEQVTLYDVVYACISTGEKDK